MKGETTDEHFWKTLYNTPITFIWDSNKPLSYGYGNWYGGDDWDREKPSKRKHEFTPVLLVNTTVWDCKHCGIKKEEAESEYCEESSFDIREW